MLLLSIVVGLPNQPLGQGQVWTVFILNGLFGLGFAVSAYGLWTRRNWGRLLFCGLLIVWAIFYIAALLLPGGPASQPDYSLVTLVANTIPYLLGSGLAVWYLNLSYIKALFSIQE